MDKNLKINFLVAPITICLLAVVTIILVVTKQDWVYYLIGGFTGLLNHSLLVKQTARLARYAKLDPEGTTLNPKKTVLVWYMLRILVFVGVFLTIVLNDYFKENNNIAIHLLLAFGGYLTSKVVLLILYLVFRRDVKE